MMAPLVARTHDDDGDGKIDQNDSPDVIFVAYGGGGDDFGDGILRIISGKDGSAPGCRHGYEVPLDELCKPRGR